jgi:hypothetical protein
MAAIAQSSLTLVNRIIRRAQERPDGHAANHGVTYGHPKGGTPIMLATTRQALARLLAGRAVRLRHWTDEAAG